MNKRIHRHLCRPGGESKEKAENLKPKAMATKPPEMAWRDYLIMLLHIAAEIEHALMVEYLYAAYSLGGDNLTEEQQTKVTTWQNTILSVAREEMGHLMTVQNLLCLLGGPVSFERNDIPFDNPFYPFPFRLEPLTLKSLSLYVYAEMPSQGDLAKMDKSSMDAVGAEFANEDQQKILKFVNKLVKADMAHSVGEVYEWIIKIISNPKWIVDSDFRPENYCYQASWDDWGRGYAPAPTRPDGTKTTTPHKRQAHLIIEQMATRTEAIAALQEVAGQGEAPHLRVDNQDEDSHFDRFISVFQGMERVKGWKAVRAVPMNPTTLAKGYPKHSTPITHPASRAWANLFNVRYRMLLTYLGHSFRLARTAPGEAPGVRGAAMHKVFGEMYNLKTIAGILVRMPLSERVDERRAGPPFEMPYSMELPPGEADCWRLHKDIILSSQEICKHLLRTAGEFGKDTPPEGAEYLKTLQSLDRQSMAWIDQILTNERLNRRNGI